MANPPNHWSSLTLSLPDWVASLVQPGMAYFARQERMRLAIELASNNVAARTGGPFGAAVFEAESGRLIAVGVNVVVPVGCSLAHAEAMAIGLAQKAQGTHDLAAPGLPRMELVCSAQPCCQCFGVIWWSGIRGLVIGARAEDVEQLAGFREGPLPDNWSGQLHDRTELPPIEIEVDLLRTEAIEPLRAYAAAGQSAYNPGALT